MSYELVVLVVGLVGLAALFSNRLTERIRVPAPAVMFVAAAVLVQVVPGIEEPPERLVERLVTVALLFILFDGGVHIGWRRFRSATVPITVAGVAGTFVTVAAAGFVLHAVFGLAWFPALLVATAVAPTDPAMVFSVLGKREIEGDSGTILEGESGANDPVGIALIAGLLAAGSVNASAFGQVGLVFVVQMVVGAAVGLLGGRLLVVVMRVGLPSEALYPIRTLAFVLVLYGATGLAHGSGFLAVFVAGIVIGDARAPYKREVERFHSALAGISEIVVFVVLGLTVRLGVLADLSLWVTGLVLALLLTLVIRPLVIGACLVRSGLRRDEKAFVLFAGLKGAVPILLAEMLREADVPQAERLYGLIVVVVIFSVLVQATLTPTVARLLHLPFRTIEPEPWTLGVRLRDEPEGVARLRVGEGAPAVGRTVGSLDELGESFWINFLVRDRQAVAITGGTRLEVGDELLVQAGDETHDQLSGFFERAPG